jgi:DcuC family C4-dicarboxylate transporter
MKLFLGLLIIAVAVYAIVRRFDVRLVLLLTALALGLVGGDVAVVVRTFLATLSNEQFVVPICCAMGFAQVLRLTQCDQHLVQLLVRPLRRVRVFLLPGAVLVGFLVNLPVISQTSTVVAIGYVLVPLLLAAPISRASTGAALLLGASIGGELLNPGSPEFLTVSTTLGITPAECMSRMVPLLFIHLGVATTVFWLLSLRAEARFLKQEPPTPGPASKAAEAPLRVNLLKAAVPLLPIALLLMVAGPLYLVPVPRDWFVGLDQQRLFDVRLIGAAMLVGVVAAALTTRKAVPDTARAFFEGAGYAVTHIISLIVAAQCFGETVKGIGLADLIGDLVRAVPGVLLPSAAGLPLAFAWLSGTGFGATQSLFQFFVKPAVSLGIDPIRVGSVVSIAGAAGRTMSPVAAVTLMCAAMTETNPLVLVRRVALPLLAGLVAVVLAAMILVRT